MNKELHIMNNVSIFHVVEALDKLGLRAGEHYGVTAEAHSYNVYVAIPLPKFNFPEELKPYRPDPYEAERYRHKNCVDGPSEAFNLWWAMARYLDTKLADNKEYQRISSMEVTTLEELDQRNDDRAEFRAEFAKTLPELVEWEKLWESWVNPLGLPD